MIRGGPDMSNTLELQSPIFAEQASKRHKANSPLKTSSRLNSVLENSPLRFSKNSTVLEMKDGQPQFRIKVAQQKSPVTKGLKSTTPVQNQQTSPTPELKQQKSSTSGLVVVYAGI
ncbi:uncharacterized protein LOC127873321 isoform X3 [Dreissena polymorpha]|uniref:uncharacterized protein LOC127873321 isoform X3 n=1 Tax=Dreissena polymorpha TaxID=45954 RepID=UPI002264BCF5|nr:uncharacterized protein LOC127873321 isoform X3 [Dreissena polymorpha]